MRARGFHRLHGSIVTLMAGSVLLLGRPVAAQEAAATEPFLEVRASIQRTLIEEGIPSLAVGVARDGEILWEAGFGWADREDRIPASPHTMYSLASISKPITATGLMTLVADGEIDLDRPANDYLGAGRIVGGAGDPEGATVRRVLAHTAGLPLHYQFFYEDGGYHSPGMDQTIARYGVLVNPPGEVYQYSNLGYGVLDHIIARVSGRPYEDFMRREVFLPLGMTRTAVHLPPDLAPHAAERYDDDGRPIPFYDFDHRGASAVYSSAHDLLLFGLFHLGDPLPEQRVILRDSLRLAMRRVHTPGDEEEGYALGWAVSDDHGLRRVSHSGGMPGVRTFLALYPEQDLVVTVLANTGTNEVFRITEDLVAALVPSYADSLAKTRAAEREEEGEESPPDSSVTLPSRLVGPWEGHLVTWDDRVAFRLEVREDGDIHVRIGEGLETVLNPLGQTPLWNEEEGRLVGRFAGTIPTSDARRHPHSVLLDLRLRDGRLSGQASAQTTEPPVYYALSSYVRLTRAGSDDDSGRGLSRRPGPPAPGAPERASTEPRRSGVGARTQRGERSRRPAHAPPATTPTAPAPSPARCIPPRSMPPVRLITSAATLPPIHTARASHQGPPLSRSDGVTAARPKPDQKPLTSR